METISGHLITVRLMINKDYTAKDRDNTSQITLDKNALSKHQVIPYQTLKIFINAALILKTKQLTNVFTNVVAFKQEMDHL